MRDLPSRLDALFGRFAHPWLAALAAAGAVWFLVGFPVAYLGTPVHPVFNLLGAFLHFLGLGTLLASGVVFSVLWWRNYLGDRFLSG
jgi:hypothetical protein